MNDLLLIVLTYHEKFENTIVADETSFEIRLCTMIYYNKPEVGILQAAKEKVTITKFISELIKKIL